jgi:hypothetical protein
MQPSKEKIFQSVFTNQMKVTRECGVLLNYFSKVIALLFFTLDSSCFFTETESTTGMATS